VRVKPCAGLLLRLTLRRPNRGRRKYLFYSNSHGRSHGGPLTGNRLFLHPPDLGFILHDVNNAMENDFTIFHQGRKAANGNLVCDLHQHTSAQQQRVSAKGVAQTAVDTPSTSL
jgi:hypothetical protein